MAIKICVAVDDKGGFARDRQIPWNIPEDFNHFLETTRGSVCITGRHSYEEMADMKRARLGSKYDPTAPILSNRETFVVSSTLDPDMVFDATVVTSVTDTINKFKSDDRDVFVLGGYDAYVEAMPHVDELIITRVPGDYMCDRFFPMQELANGEFLLQKTEYIITKTHGRLPVDYHTRILEKP